MNIKQLEVGALVLGGLNSIITPFFPASSPWLDMLMRVYWLILQAIKSHRKQLASSRGKAQMDTIIKLLQENHAIISKSEFKFLDKFKLRSLDKKRMQILDEFDNINKEINRKLDEEIQNNKKH